MPLGSDTIFLAQLMDESRLELSISERKNSCGYSQGENQTTALRAMQAVTSSSQAKPPLPGVRLTSPAVVVGGWREGELGQGGGRNETGTYSGAFFVARADAGSPKVAAAGGGEASRGRR